jgi:N-acetylneuraminic acid mutarotase
MNKFSKNSILVGLLFLGIVPKAQVNINSKWTWIKGDSTINVDGIYGTQDIASNVNKPGARFNSVGWTDVSNNLWLFGGFGIARNSTDYINDLWKYNTSLNQWTWIKGDSTASGYGIYGTQGISAGTTRPGGRYYGNTWTDNAGNFWRFGGVGYALSGNAGFLNDLWKYDPTINQWTWINGGNTIENNGIYGEQGIAAVNNKPGARNAGVSWKDKSGGLWLFGGEGFAESGGYGYLNDLWKYDLSLRQWTWVNGDKTAGSYGVYGTQGIASINNKPGARAAGVSWTDNAGNFWLLGGNGFAAGGSLNELNDLWKYDPLANQWTWVSGDKLTGIYGVYGTRGISSISNKPGARVAASGCTDSLGNLFLFGGIGYARNSIGSLNDLWQYNPINNQWTWIKGDSTVGNNGVYGVQGIAATSNKPGSRFGNTCWADNSGNLYLFGGTGFAASGTPDLLNDLWKISVNNTVLPLTLLNFSGSVIQNNVLLSWQTTLEFNTAYFNIRHSIDGKNFTTLGLVNAVNNSSFTKKYSFTDQNPRPGSNFYRLKIADNDGKVSYSKIVEVTTPLKKSLSIFPNPVQDIIYVEVNGDDEKATIQIFDMSGRKVREEIIVLNGTNYFSLSIKNIPKGVYSLILKKQYTTERRKFVKQ